MDVAVNSNAYWFNSTEARIETSKRNRFHVMQEEGFDTTDRWQRSKLHPGQDKKETGESIETRSSALSLQTEYSASHAHLGCNPVS